MPLYEICHSHPLSKHQKDIIAQGITHLHSTTFLTPSLYVNVRFTRPEPTGDFYLAGKAKDITSPNRILAEVRVSPSRTKEMFDELALKIQDVWYDAVNNAGDHKGRSNGHVDSIAEKKAKKLHFVVFAPIVTALENGVNLPSAGKEGTWLKDNMAYFKEQAEVHGDEEFRDMLREINERPDLRALI